MLKIPIRWWHMCMYLGKCKLNQLLLYNACHSPYCFYCFFRYRHWGIRSALVTIFHKINPDTALCGFFLTIKNNLKYAFLKIRCIFLFCFIVLIDFIIYTLRLFSYVSCFSVQRILPEKTVESCVLCVFLCFASNNKTI